MDIYTIYCTPEQTKKVLELGAPIEWGYHKDDFQNSVKIKSKFYAQIPTAEQMICWLEDKGLLMSITARNTPDNPIYNYSINKCEESWNTFPSRKEATLAAIDAALDYLTNNKKAK